MDPSFTRQEMRRRLRYHPANGAFSRIGGTQGVVPSAPLGTMTTTGKRQAMFLGRRYNVDQLVWLWETGELPRCGIKHRNGDNSDDRFSNLYLATDAHLTLEGQRLSRFCRKILGRALGAKSARGGYVSRLLGYGHADLVTHIEGQFEPWMRWDNRGEWHIDHITPIAWLIRNGERDPAVINALSNLRPLSARENLAKGSKVAA